MFEKLIENLYLRQKDNLVYYDPYMNTKTAKFYEDKATDLFDKIICKVFYLDLNIDVSYLSEEDIRDIIRKVQYKENIIEIFRIRGDKFIILTKIDFLDTLITSLNGVAYGYTRKDKFTHLDDAVDTAIKYALIRKSKMINHKEKHHNNYSKNDTHSKSDKNKKQNKYSKKGKKVE